MREPLPIDVPMLRTVALVTLGMLVAIVTFWWFEVRQLRWRRQVVAAIPPEPHDRVIRVPLFERIIAPIEYTPPDDTPPGLLGLIVDGYFNASDLGATLVDLARRGYLRVQRIPTSWIDEPNWELRRAERTGGAGDSAAYERQLLDDLFRGGTVTTYRAIRRLLSARSAEASRIAEEEGVRRGWFRERPSVVRNRWLTRFGFLSLAAFLVFNATLAAGMPLVGLPVLLGSLTLLLLATRIAERTAEGHRMMIRAMGFRRFIMDAETRRADFAEHERLFYDYLPYAIAFGAIRPWTRHAPSVVPGFALFHGDIKKALHFAERMTDLGTRPGHTTPAR